MATNACLDELRRRGRRPGATSDEDLERALTDAAVPAGGHGGSGGSGGPDAVADRLDVEDALRRLPVDFRAPVVLRDLCGLDYAEIADVLGIPPGTVRSRIARGRAALVPLLGNPAPPAGRPTPRP